MPEYAVEPGEEPGVEEGGGARLPVPLQLGQPRLPHPLQFPGAVQQHLGGGEKAGELGNKSCRQLKHQAGRPPGKHPLQPVEMLGERGLQIEEESHDRVVHSYIKQLLYTLCLARQ